MTSRVIPWPWFLRNIAVGACLGGIYGGLHDQVSWALSREYFTRFKFDQFAWADVGLAPQAFASLVGVLATWWAGAIAAYVVSRMAFRHAFSGGPAAWPLRRVVVHLLFVLGAAVLGGLLGEAYAQFRQPDVERLWSGWRHYGGVEDLAAFARVGYIHNFGYGGALVGIVSAALWVRRQGRRAALQAQG
ncbi:MAG TPA: hypothetical protein PKE00_04350 [Planctomycetota bacterium]|nr:hypothetical protein [Planctomycetota bacterium]